MHRAALCLPLLVLLAGPARADDERDRELVGKLQAQVERAVREVGPAVACVLVSRSEDYHKAPYWGVPADPEQPGRLGRFDPAAAARRVPTDARDRARALRAIATHDLSDPDAFPESYGSGFVLDRAGLVLTNAHVVKNATKVYVRLPGKRGSWADIHASDPRSDLAVLRLLDAPPGLKPLPLATGAPSAPGSSSSASPTPSPPASATTPSPRPATAWSAPSASASCPRPTSARWSGTRSPCTTTAPSSRPAPAPRPAAPAARCSASTAR